jgi:phage recombination protein Bet
MADETKALAAVEPSHGAALAKTLEFSIEQKKMIRDSFLTGASDAEAAVLMELARLRRLNPLTRQVHFVKRWNQDRGCETWAAQVGIDGFRAIAERTGMYDGQDEPEFEYDEKGQVKLCRVRVYRKDWTRPSVGVAHFSEYAQYKKDRTLTNMWLTKPHVMLAKCSEGLAMRKAFPDDTSGLYAEEEMGEEREINPAPSEPNGKSRTENLAAKVGAKAAAAKAPAVPQTQVQTQPAPAAEKTVDAAPAAKAEPVLTFGAGGLKGKKLVALSPGQLKEMKGMAELKLMQEPNATWAPTIRANLVEIDAELAERAIEAEQSVKAAQTPAPAQPEAKENSRSAPF